MTTRQVVIGDEKDGAFNRALAENEGSIYPPLVSVLDTYVRTRCPHTEKGQMTLQDGDTLCGPCSGEVRTNIALTVGSGDVNFSQEARAKLDDICDGIPAAAVAIWAAHGGRDASQEEAEKATTEIGDLVSDMASVIHLGTHLQRMGDEAKAALV